MAADYYTKLSITIESSSGERLDEPNAITTTFSTEMSDCSIHAWFDVFEKVLAVGGFSERNVMSGGCQLAFNERRSVSTMRDVAKEYDLRLLEDLNSMAPDGPSADSAN